VGDKGATNLQNFAQKLGTIAAPPVFASNGTFAVSGRSFPVLIDALNTSCDNQRNLCADRANAVNFQVRAIRFYLFKMLMLTVFQDGVTIDACDKQQTACRTNAATIKQ
jgi:hypothetical protein